jgi:hypothetical protein
MPHGRFVGGPYSSWLKKLPSRPAACMTKIPGATMSAQRHAETRYQRARTSTAIAPVTNPPKMPSPLYGGRMILIGSLAYSCHWSTTWYSRPPTSAATATMISELPMMSVRSPNRRACRTMIQYAPASPIA